MTQPDYQVTVTEGHPLTVKCTYSISGSPYLFWYVQYPNRGLQFLLKYLTGDKLVKGNFGFEAEFDKQQTSFHLKILSALATDSAVYFCAGSDTVVGAAGRAEHKPLSTVRRIFLKASCASLHKRVVWFQVMSVIIMKSQCKATEFVHSTKVL